MGIGVYMVCYVGRCLGSVVANLLVQENGRLDQTLAHLLDILGEVVQIEMSVQQRAVDSLEHTSVGHTAGNSSEVALHTLVDGEGPGSGVHGCQVTDVHDLLVQTQIRPVWDPSVSVCVCVEEQGGEV